MNRISSLTLKDLKDFIPLILLGTSIAGGLGQFINLTSISPSLLNFFSTSQMITKGVFFLAFSIVALIFLSLNILIIDWFRSSKYKWMPLVISIVLLIINYNIGVYFHLIHFFWLSITFLIILFLNEIGELIPSKKKQNDKKGKVINGDNDTIILLAISIFLFSIFFFKYELKYNYLSAKDFPINIPKEVYNYKESYKLAYFNDKYAFYESDSEKIIVKQIDKLIEVLPLKHKEEMWINDSTISLKTQLHVDSIENLKNKYIDSIKISIKDYYQKDSLLKDSLTK